MSEKYERDLSQRLYEPRKRAAQVLGIDEETVARLGNQGRLEARIEGGEVQYSAVSILRYQAEELFQATQEKVGDECPDLSEQIDQLLSIQYQRGVLDGVIRAGNQALSRYPQLEERLKEAMREARSR